MLREIARIWVMRLFWLMVCIWLPYAAYAFSRYYFSQFVPQWVAILQP